MAKKKSVGFAYQDYLSFSKRANRDFDLFDMDDYSSYDTRRTGAKSSSHMDIVYPDIDYFMESKLTTALDELRNDKKLIPNSQLAANACDRIPDFMIRDIFKQYYNKNVKYKMGKENYWWKNLLGDLDNYMMKISTNNSYLNSSIITKHVAAALMEAMTENPDWQKKMDKLNDELKNDAEKQKEQGQGQPQDSAQGQDQKEQGESGSGQSGDNSNQPSHGNAMDNLKGMKEKLDKAMSDSQKEISDMADALQSLPGLDPHKNREDLEMMQMIASISGSDKITIRAISRFVKKTVKGFKAALTGSVSTFEENMFEADEISDIVDLELMPFDALLDDINVKTNKASIKFDLYVDCSGSMGSGCDMGNRKNIARMDLAKVLAHQMNRMNILNNIFEFEGSVKQITKDKILQMRAGGGTRIDACVENIALTKVPSVILSDGDDSVNIYDDRCYFLSIANGLNYITEESKKYCDKSRMVLFNQGKMFRGSYRDSVFSINKGVNKQSSCIQYRTEF
jgi:hypothetical protein